MSYPQATFRDDPSAWARSLSISREAMEVYLAGPVVDLHVDSFIWTRVFRYNLHRRHGRGPTRARFLSQVDLPRVEQASLSGAVWSITTNPLWPSRVRAMMFRRNLRRITAVLSAHPHVQLVQDAAGYQRAIAQGKHAAFIGIQGGNAVDHDPTVLDERILRVTLVHLSTSSLGATSSPLASLRGGHAGLTPAGRRMVELLNARRIFVDLAHIHPQGFWDAVEVHDRTQPLMVSHTGVSGVHQHWRNVDDRQLKAVADSGGVVGVMYQASFLGAPMMRVRAQHVVDHLEHIERVAGPGVAALGSDWDGMIIPPPDMLTVLELPRLVQGMLDRRFSVETIHGIMGNNFLAALARLRGNA